MLIGIGNKMKRLNGKSLAPRLKGDHRRFLTPVILVLFGHDDFLALRHSAEGSMNPRYHAAPATGSAKT